MRVFGNSGAGKENKTALIVKKSLLPVTGRIAETLAVTCFGGIISIVSFEKTSVVRSVIPILM